MEKETERLQSLNVTRLQAPSSFEENMLYIVTIIIVLGFILTLSLCKIAKKEVPSMWATTEGFIECLPVVSDTLGSMVQRGLTEQARNDTHLPSV